MSLDARTKQEIAEIVGLVFEAKLKNFRKELTAAIAETIDWYTENLFQIFDAQTDERRKEIRALMAKDARKSVGGFVPR